MLLGNLKLKAKILGVSSVYLSGMICMTLLAGYIFVTQYNAIGEAVLTASERINAANLTSSAITNIDRNIQALIASDEKRVYGLPLLLQSAVEQKLMKLLHS